MSKVTSCHWDTVHCQKSVYSYSNCVRGTNNMFVDGCIFIIICRSNSAQKCGIKNNTLIRNFFLVTHLFKEYRDI